MQSLFDFMRRFKREDGSELCEPFIRAPKRRTDPEYYEVGRRCVGFFVVPSPFFYNLEK